MGELAKYDPMGIDEKSEYIQRGQKILKEYTGTWTYHPPTPLPYFAVIYDPYYQTVPYQTVPTYLETGPTNNPISQVREQSEGN